jgi:hypothetical protein
MPYGHCARAFAPGNSQDQKAGGFVATVHVAARREFLWRVVECFVKNSAVLIAAVVSCLNFSKFGP